MLPPSSVPSDARQGLSDMTMQHLSIALGISIGLFSSFVQSLGLTIQRKSHLLNKLLPEGQQRVEHRRPLWLLGFAIFISSNVFGSFVQIASLPVVILAPLGAVSLLWNAFFARILLGDVFSPWMVLGTVLIAGGAVLVAEFGIVPEPSRSLEDLLALFSRPAFLIYFSSLCVVVLVCLLTTHYFEYTIGRKFLTVIRANGSSPESGLDHRPSSMPSTSLLSQDMETGATEETPLMDRKSTTPSPSPSALSGIYDSSTVRTRLLVAISYASFSGIISGMCLVFAKTSVELLLLTWKGENQFWRWQTWVLLLGLGSFALLQLWYLHKALILADPTLVCPSAFCFYNLSSIVNGLVYFDQFSMISPLHLAFVGVGIMILLSGVWVVSIQSEGKEMDVESWSDGEEDIREDVPAISEGEEAQDDRTSHPPSTTNSGSTHLVMVSTGTEAARDGGETSRRPGVVKRVLKVVMPYRLKGTHDLGQHRGSSRHGPVSPVIPVTSTLGAGFQIGLSPVSPGFAIVPRERRRRVSGLGHARNVREEARRRRRTLSEGDVRGNGDGDGEETDGEEMDRRSQGGGGRRWGWFGIIWGS